MCGFYRVLYTLCCWGDVMTWIINRFIDDKWIKYYSNPKRALRLYIVGGIIHPIIVVLLIFYILPFLIFYGYLETIFGILVYTAVGILITLHELNMWVIGEYLRFGWQPIKVRISGNGLKIINLFGKSKLIKWENIQKINFSEEQKVYVVRMKPESKFPPIIAPQKINIFLDLKIGPKVLEQWKLFRSKNEDGQVKRRHKNE